MKRLTTQRHKSGVVDQAVDTTERAHHLPHFGAAAHLVAQFELDSDDGCISIKKPGAVGGI